MKKLGKMLNLRGETFGRLSVLARDPRKDKHVFWRCQCVCKKEIVVRSDRLTMGVVNSCRACNKIRFNHLAAAERRCWDSMIQRCNNPNQTGYVRYGGRGVKVCERWQTFETFLADMGPRPSPKHSIDRCPDNNGNYELDNCRWATEQEQQRNTSRNVWVEWKCEQRLFVELAEELGLTNRQVAKRLKHGWTLADALTRPVRHRKANRNRKRRNPLAKEPPPAWRITPSPVKGLRPC